MSTVVTCASRLSWEGLGSRGRDRTSVDGFSVSDSSEPATTRPSASSQPSAETVDPTPATDLENLRDDLLGMGFKCTPPSGTAGLSKCSKGEVDTAAYGKQPAQTVNVEFETGDVHGFGKPKTLKTIGKYFTVEDFGDDGTGGRLFGTTS